MTSLRRAVSYAVTLSNLRVLPILLLCMAGAGGYGRAWSTRAPNQVTNTMRPDFAEARTRSLAMAANRSYLIIDKKMGTRTSAHINLLSFPRLSIRLVTRNTSPFLREVPPH